MMQDVAATTASMENEEGREAYQPLAEIVEKANITDYMRKKGFSTWDELYQLTCDHTLAIAPGVG